MIGRPEISRLSVAGGVSEGAQEKDYVLAWLLAARATLGPSSLVFKGGSALRRCDFSADDQPKPEEIGVILDRLANQVRDPPDFDAVWRRLIRGLRQAGY